MATFFEFVGSKRETLRLYMQIWEIYIISSML